MGLPHRWRNVVILIATLTLVFIMRLSFWSKWICWTFLAAASLFDSSMVPEPCLSLRVVLFGAQCDKPGVSISTSGQCLFQSRMDNTVKSNTQELERWFKYLGLQNRIRQSTSGRKEPAFRVCGIWHPVFFFCDLHRAQFFCVLHCG